MRSDEAPTRYDPRRGVRLWSYSERASTSLTPLATLLSMVENFFEKY